MTYCKNYQNVTQRHKESKCCWKNGINRLAWHKTATNLQFIKNAVSAKHNKVKCNRDSPGGPVVKNPSCNAEDTSSIPGWGAKIPHATGQLSPCATTTERKILHATTKTQHSQKINIKKKLFKKKWSAIKRGMPVLLFLSYTSIYVSVFYGVLFLKNTNGPTVYSVAN